MQIHPKTLRPVCVISGERWDHWAKAVFKVEDRKELFKGCKYIEEFILKHRKQPSRHEIAVFYFNRYVVAGKRSTLPLLTEQWIEELLARYALAFQEGFDIKAVISALKESRSIEKRIALESS